ncbi:hypothetical protein BCV70DRAFT_201753 [Testicularia cyperi]|uniref:Uncharacterized protein n=1 Tax=Testicularia cyperi TaxID=1882483 RepID=A0A317XKT5_9BASI|nr:hypothetical protein BCV70DRAFT_201753 [Testicularia cyperi]
MPPLPANGSSYPPSASAYQPLSTSDGPDDAEDDVEAYPSSGWQHAHGRERSRRLIRQRPFFLSPYQSEANSPTQILKAFLAETRSKSDQSHTRRDTKQLSLRITARTAASSPAKSVDLPLPLLDDQDSLPFALPDDVPCLRGLHPTDTRPPWKRYLLWPVQALTESRYPTHLEKLQLQRYADPISLLSGHHLQVWNGTQGKPMYASADEVDRYATRLRNGVTAPWVPLNDLTSVASSSIPGIASHTRPSNPPASATHTDNNAEPEADQTEQNPNDDDAFDLNFLSGKGDFDLGVFFKKKRDRKASRLVSVGLQEAIERFADDRHFSKWLICRQVVWGWDWEELRRAVEGMLEREVADRRRSGRGVGSEDKGKGRQLDHDHDNNNENDNDKENKFQATGIKVTLQVVGLEARPIFHVVWSPVPQLLRIPTLLLKPIIIGYLAIMLFVVLSLLLLREASTATILLAIILVQLSLGLPLLLIRFSAACIYDNVGTAYSLRPRWIPLDLPSDWSRLQVQASLGRNHSSSAPLQGSNGEVFAAENPFVIDNDNDNEDNDIDINTHDHPHQHQQQNQHKSDSKLTPSSPSPSAPELRQTQHGWLLRRGISESDWLASNRARLLHALL